MTGDASVRQDRLRRKLSARALVTTNLIVYQCPADRLVRVDSIIVCNVSSSQVNFRLWHTNPSESPGQPTALFYDMIVRPNSTMTLEVPIYMTSGDKLVGYASVASSLGISVFGEES